MEFLHIYSTACFFYSFHMSPWADLAQPSPFKWFFLSLRKKVMKVSRPNNTLSPGECVYIRSRFSRLYLDRTVVFSTLYGLLTKFKKFLYILRGHWYPLANTWCLDNHFWKIIFPLWYFCSIASIRYNLHTVIFTWYVSLACPIHLFLANTQNCENYHHYLIVEYFYNPKWNPRSIKSHSRYPSPSP